MVSNNLKEILSKSHTSGMSNNGYLVCEECNGYYQLQEGEIYSDFDYCECGGSLSYFADINEYYDLPEAVFTENNINLADDDEIRIVLINLKNKAEKRKKLFEELSQKLKVQENLLDDIKKEKWYLWEDVDGESSQEDISMQKNLLKDIIYNEKAYLFDEEVLMENIIDQESKLMNIIQNKRESLTSAKNFKDKIPTPIEGQLQGAGYSIFDRKLSILIIFLIIIGLLYLFFMLMLS